MDLAVHSLVIAGWTGRNAAAVEHHIRELEAIGVRRPKNVPTFYRAAVGNLTSAPHIQVAGRHATGEAEFALVSMADGLWIGLGSDHTDRELERHSVSLSKQVCAKPIGASLWRYEDVADHWDELELHSYAHIGGTRRPYQQGKVTSLRQPVDLIQAYCQSANLTPTRLPAGTVMFCGTLPVQGAMEFADRFELELRDPRLGRSLHHAYTIEALPLAD
jgi:hypothetical protein